MRIRARLALYGATVTAIAMLGFGLLLGILVGQSAPADQERDLQALAEQTVAGLAGLSGEQVAAAAPLAQIDPVESTDAFVEIVDPEGTVLYATGAIDGTPVRMPAALIIEAEETGASMAVLHPEPGLDLRVHAISWLTDDGDPIGVVVAGQSTAFADEQVTGLRAVLWVSGIITLIAASVVAWLVSGRALKPLQNLVETTDRIGETGDLSGRLAPNQSRDEVGRLTTSFNAMLTELEMSQARLAQSLGAQRRFVADASHELRSPLTTIRNNAGFLLDHPGAADTDRAEAIADITAEAERMTTLVDDMLTLALADADAPVQRAPVDLSVLLHDAARRAERADISVGLVAPAPAVVLGDAAALSQVVWILIDNAAKHGKGPISISLATQNGTAAVEVKDEGPGIPADHVDRVFDRFHRADPARSPAGAGLGLAIAREIVEAHDGSIKAEDRGHGATLRFQLPLLV